MRTSVVASKRGTRSRAGLRMTTATPEVGLRVGKSGSEPGEVGHQRHAAWIRRRNSISDFSLAQWPLFQRTHPPTSNTLWTTVTTIRLYQTYNRRSSHPHLRSPHKRCCWHRCALQAYSLLVRHYASYTPCLLLILSTPVFAFSKRKSASKGNAVLLVGPSDAGKTAILSSVCLSDLYCYRRLG